MSARNVPINSVIVRPDVGMLALFPAMNYKPWYAIGEFVDNALQSWQSNRERLSSALGSARININIEFNAADETITINDDAAGICTTDIPRAFTPASPPADQTGLSQFGIGMKSAAAWYAEHFTVTTTALGEYVRRTVVFDIPNIVESNVSSIPLEETAADPLEHGTTLVLRNLNHPIPRGRTLGKIRDYLTSIYRAFIVKPDVHIVVGGKELSYSEPKLLVASRWDQPSGPSRHWRKKIALTLPSGARVSGWGGLLAKGKAKQAGFAMLYRGKVVKGAGGAANDADDGYKPYEVFGASNSFESQRLIGELDVSEIPVTHTKDALLWVGDDEEAFIEQLASELDKDPLPLLHMARGHRVTERSRSAQQHVKNSMEAIAHVLEHPLTEDSVKTKNLTHAAVVSDVSVSEPIEQTISISQFAGGPAGESILFRVVDDPSFAELWLRLINADKLWSLEINRSHPFMQSFASVPNMDVEPVMRLALAFALTQIRAERSGAVEPGLLIPLINELVSGPLSRRTNL